jgi:hypothetical protein
MLLLFLKHNIAPLWHDARLKYYKLAETLRLDNNARAGKNAHSAQYIAWQYIVYWVAANVCIIIKSTQG